VSYSDWLASIADMTDLAQESHLQVGLRRTTDN